LTVTDAKCRHYRRKRIESLTSTDPDILELSKPDYRNPHPPPIVPYVQPQTYDYIYDVRVCIAHWSKEYGPVDCWPHVLRELHEEAVENDDEEEWHRDLKDKMRQGLTVLRELRALFLELPTNTPWMIRDIWCQAFELAGEVHRGIACIQAHLAMYED
jgi:hypothetical protein